MASSRPLQELSPVLVANRGEIAVRVVRTLRSLGLGSIAVANSADRGSPHRLAADLALAIESYLEPDELLAAAERAGARSVHPGYGFLSENAGFASAVTEAGLIWIGPAPAAIELMGDKGRSKRLAERAGVPIVPGTGGEDASDEQIAALAAEHGFPLMIKALAGGGGKGMRVVRAADEIGGATAAARREAEAAFGDGRLLAERYLERPRHVEIQVLADRHGGVVHLGERECSLQRRHQKVIEEAPSPAIDESTREAMGRSAIALAEACDYEGAGTVEFIVPAGGEGFHFLEMNTRLQVEHPVTELVWGVDLVEQQLRVAAGERLELSQERLRPSGHAVEARLYAEDPAAGFLPATGTIRRWREPGGDGIRIDSGVAEGTVIGTDYDPMLAKLIAHGPDRPTALARLVRALADLEPIGVATNAQFSRRLLELEEVRAGELDTGLLERGLADLDLEPPEDLPLAAAAALFWAETAALSLPPGPWRRRFERIGEVAVRDGAIATADGSHELDVSDAGGGRLLIELDGIARTYAFAIDPDRAVWVTRGAHQLEARLLRRAAAAADAAGSLEAPMPGKVLGIEVAKGDRVEEGDLLLVLESMKMELQISAPGPGLVDSLELAVGDQVAQGQTLVSLRSVEEGDGHDE